MFVRYKVSMIKAVTGMAVHIHQCNDADDADDDNNNDT